APYQVETDGMVVAGEPVDLKPEYVGCDFGDLLESRAAHHTKRVGHAGSLGGFRQQLVGVRPDHHGAAHRGHAERRGVAAAEQLDVERRQRWTRGIAWHKFDRIERSPVM